jgi:pantoate--beta-alanine ligase
MLIIKDSKELHTIICNYKKVGKKIGFVPTMGALHNGHISLINSSNIENDITICSIFVNPTQFNNAVDFEKYPITIEKDTQLLKEANCSILFLPTVKEIYPDGINNLNNYTLGFIETVYDGAFRPGHFQGVCNVVQRLFEITIPHNAYFGLKDYQQCMVIKKLVELMNWQHKIELHFCATLREADGLAMSSRNTRLNATERQIAPIIYETLQFIKSNLIVGDLTMLLQNAKDKLVTKNLKIDYLDIADAYNLEPISFWDGKQKLVCVVAAFLNEVRLIDNVVIT